MRGAERSAVTQRPGARFNPAPVPPSSCSSWLILITHGAGVLAHGQTHCGARCEGERLERVRRSAMRVLRHARLARLPSSVPLTAHPLPFETGWSICSSPAGLDGRRSSRLKRIHIYVYASHVHTRCPSSTSRHTCTRKARPCLRGPPPTTATTSREYPRLFARGLRRDWLLW